MWRLFKRKPRLKVEGDPYVNIPSGVELRLAGSPGSAGQVLTSQGSGTNPTWSVVTRSMLEYPTAGVTFAYLIATERMKYYLTDSSVHECAIGTVGSFTDKALVGLNIDCANHDDYHKYAWIQRMSTDPLTNSYLTGIATYKTTADLGLVKYVGGTATTLGTEAADLAGDTPYDFKFSVSGSALSVYRSSLTTPKISATDTSLASGAFGCKSTSSYYRMMGMHWHLLIQVTSPSSPGAPALAVVEVETAGSGAAEDPWAPALGGDLAEVSQLSGLPGFLYREARRYEILRARGFTDEEIREVFGGIQHQVDLNAVTWGAFEFSGGSPTNIVFVYGDNPYRQGAIQRQAERAKKKGLRVFDPPRGYGEAVALYDKLKHDFPHWLAGKDNFAYMCLGWEELDVFQCVDFYYGELLEHKTHYQQLKQVNPGEIERRLSELVGRLSRVAVLTDERDKHVAKAKEVLRRGW